MTPKWCYCYNSAKDSLSACDYHLTEIKKTQDYVPAYAHTKALLFEAKSTLDSIAAALNDVFCLGIIESHVFFNEEFIAKLNAQTQFPSLKERRPQLVPQSCYDALVAPDHYFPRLRTYLSTMFTFLAIDNTTYMLSDTPGVYSFEPGVEAPHYCEKLLESVKYVFHLFSELIDDVLSTQRYDHRSFD